MFPLAVMCDEVFNTPVTSILPETCFKLEPPSNVLTSPSSINGNLPLLLLPKVSAPVGRTIAPVKIKLSTSSVFKNPSESNMTTELSVPVGNVALIPSAIMFPLALMSPLAVICPLKVCVSPISSPNIFEPLVNIIDDEMIDDVI